MHLYEIYSILYVRAQADIKRECRQQTNVSWGNNIFYIARI